MSIKIYNVRKWTAWI